ncbi:MAG: shikimate kinase [Alcanivorax sp.]
MILQTNNKITKPVILVGMMGCGKTEIGKRLAQALAVRFIDTDTVIEDEQGQSISDIFQIHGEGYFRALETKTLSQLLEGEPAVISTGGGLVTTPENLEKIENQAVSVWLRSSVETIMERIAGDDTRPLLRTSDPKKTLEDLLNARKELYSKANIHINNEESPEKVLSEIQRHLGEYYGTA